VISLGHSSRITHLAGKFIGLEAGAHNLEENGDTGIEICTEGFEKSYEGNIKMSTELQGALVFKGEIRKVKDGRRKRLNQKWKERRAQKVLNAAQHSKV
jgi:hypothetical protein